MTPPKSTKCNFKPVIAFLRAILKLQVSERALAECMSHNIQHRIRDGDIIKQRTYPKGTFRYMREALVQDDLF